MANTTDVGHHRRVRHRRRARQRAALAGYTDRDVLWGRDRDFYQLGVLSSFIGTGTYVPAPTNLPQQAVVNTVFGAYGVAPGAVLNSRSLGFNDNGTLFGQIGAINYQGPTTEYFSTVGGTVRQPVTYQEFVINPMKRKSFFGKFDFNVADSVTAYGQFLYNKTTATGQVGWSPTLFVVPTMPATNPFIPGGSAHDPGIASDTGRGFHDQPSLHGAGRSQVPDRLHHGAIHPRLPRRPAVQGLALGHLRFVRHHGRRRDAGQGDPEFAHAQSAVRSGWRRVDLRRRLQSVRSRQLDRHLRRRAAPIWRSRRTTTRSSRKPSSKPA